MGKLQVSTSEMDNCLLSHKYTCIIRIPTCPNSDMAGLIEIDVHENCLFL